MALSATHFPDTGTTYCIIYGCVEGDTKRTSMDKITRRLMVASEQTLAHPMLLVGIFAELERWRMVELMRGERMKLMSSLEALREVGYGMTANSQSPIDAWLENYSIKNALEHWVSILTKMISHIDELEHRFYLPGPTDPKDPKKEIPRKAGIRIKERLEEILLDYQEFIRDYERMTQGLTLATNLVSAYCFHCSGVITNITLIRAL